MSKTQRPRFLRRYKRAYLWAILGSFGGYLSKQTRNDDQSTQLNQDAKDLAKFGYGQELLRDMGGFANFAISFSVISILTGITQLYGYGLQHGGPLQMSVGWLLVSVFTLTVALSMAELASAYPTAGALYHWSFFLGGRTLGWFTACFNTIGQFAIMAGIDYGLAKFLIGLMGWPDTMAYSISIYVVLLFSHGVFNHLGIRIVSWLNDFSAWYHIAVILVLFVTVAMKGFAQPIDFLWTFNSTDSFAPPYSFAIGLLLAQWTLAGYDASAHVTEETIDPRRRAPWGIFLAVIISIVFGFLMLAAVTLSIQDLPRATAYGDAAFLEILKERFGSNMGSLISILIAGAMWLCGLAAMTSASRMVYAFSRDGGLPASHLWSKISPRFQTPANAIWGLIALALILGLSVKMYSAVVSIATIALYISYGLPIFARIKARIQGKDKQIGPWNLGKWSTLNAVIAILWVISITIIFMLPPNDQAQNVVGSCLGLLILAWLIVARKKFVGPRVKFEG